MKVLITGADGMLGRTLQHELQGVEVIPTNHKTADITDAAAFDRCLALHKPDVVIHCAAMTAVDRCETEIDRLTGSMRSAPKMGPLPAIATARS